MSESEPKRLFGKIVCGVSATAMAASLAFGQGEILNAQDNRLSEDQVNNLARYGKIRIYNGPNPEGNGILGYGGIVWNNDDGSNNFCTIGHVGNFNGPWQGLFENRGAGSDPAICMEVDGGIEGAPVLSADGVQEGEIVFIDRKSVV